MQKRRGDLTVVIPVFNRRDELKRCLDSIECQTVQPSRVIIVDDGSTDGSSEVARMHPIGADVVEKNHEGATVARNTGLEKVETSWTMFFDSDDLMSPDHIETAMTAATPDADIVGWDVERIDSSGKRSVKPFEPRDIGWHNIMHGTMATQRYMARTSLFRRAGGWRDDIMVWNDVEIGARMLALSPKVVKVPGVRVTVLHSVKSITGMRWLDNKDIYPATFAALASTLGEKHGDWLALKKAILAADIGREDREEGRRMYAEIEGKTAAVRFAYYYRLTGLRGAARLLRPFFSR